MEYLYTRQRVFALAMLYVLTALLLLTGCAAMNLPANEEKGGPGGAAEALPTNQPYYPTDFKDLLIPGELAWNRTDSMTIRTGTYAGGVLNFHGRVEVNSLTDFFLNTMVKNGWQMTGSVKSKDVLLAFVKPKSTCLIRIFEAGYGLRTSVNIYVTKTND